MLFLRSIKKFVSVVAASAALSIGAGAALAQEDVIKFGFASAFSGSAAEWGPIHEASAVLAVEDINAGGGIKVDGRSYKLEMIKYDHAYDPATIVTVARRAVQQDNVKFLEILGGGVISAAQPITEPAGVIVFGSGVGSAWLGPDKPLTFRSYYDSADTALQAVEYIKRNDAEAKKVVLMYPDDELGHNLAESVSTRGADLGVQFDVVFTGRDVADFYPVLLKVINLAPDYIDFGPTPSNQYASMIKQAGELGYKGKFIFSDTVNLQSLATAGVEKSAVGSVVAPAWVSFTSDIGQSWSKRYQEKAGSIQGWVAQSYDNLLLLKAAIESANSLDTAKVAEALEKVKAQGVTGEVSYGGADRIGINRIMQLSASVGVIGQTDSGSLKVDEVQ